MLSSLYICPIGETIGISVVTIYKTICTNKKFAKISTQTKTFTKNGSLVKVRHFFSKNRVTSLAKKISKVPIYFLCFCAKSVVKFFGSDRYCLISAGKEKQILWYNAGKGMWMVSITLVETSLSSISYGWLWAGIFFLFILIVALSSIFGYLEVKDFCSYSSEVGSQLN